ncbi:hypothetical protein VSR01_15980 [Actinacidiphila sp. DG2A-62]|uniref:hypothetical protein n=1 Tax=Actinacidiphila sp. DG2A-62 TaxID=3108821 RepID=UPI002DB8EA64|nr:hypothetical protein [Actinacidiphila sp. DG2A-62]MEC3994945.1 hypothetical protein [Actinacidiphila sp. DG2A-62]
MDEELTYDPVLAAQPPPAQAAGAVAPGTALVLVPEDGPLRTVRRGELVPESGAWQAVFTVDVTEHRLVLPVRLADHHVRVVVRCRVADPALIVARGVRDVGSVLYGQVRDLVAAAVAGAAGRYAAGAAVDAALEGLTGDAAVRVRDARAVLEPVGEGSGKVVRGEVVRGAAAPGPRVSRVRGVPARPRRDADGGPR